MNQEQKEKLHKAVNELLSEIKAELLSNAEKQNSTTTYYLSQEKLEKLIVLLAEALASKDIKMANLLFKLGRTIALKMEPVNAYE